VEFAPHGVVDEPFGSLGLSMILVLDYKIIIPSAKETYKE
jgi:hypothetical protein